MHTTPTPFTANGAGLLGFIRAAHARGEEALAADLLIGSGFPADVVRTAAAELGFTPDATWGELDLIDTGCSYCHSVGRAVTARRNGDRHIHVLPTSGTCDCDPL